MSDKKRFYRFVIPSIGSMVVTALYFVVDGIFVGRGVGTNGLAAVNITVPFLTLVGAITLMITVGGATLTSISLGKGDNEKANNYFNTSLLLIVIFSIVMMLISILFPVQIVKLLGASDLLVYDAAEYLKYYEIFAIFFCCSSALSAFVRNDGNPKLALWGMIVGAFSNIFLDWLFVFPLQMGLKGAAIASGLGQLLSCVTLSLHFIMKKGVLKLELPKKEKGVIIQIIKTGTPEFVTQMSPSITILCYNYLVLTTFGEIGVSAFAVISYLLEIVLAVFAGVAQGIQPLIGRSIGEQNKKLEIYFFKKGVNLNVFLSCVVYAIMIICGKSAISIFNSDAVLVNIAYNCITVYGISFIFAAVNIVYTTYYLTTKRTKDAIVVAVLRSFICNCIFIFLMPAIFGEKAIWTGMIVAEFIVMLVAIYKNKKQMEV